MKKYKPTIVAVAGSVGKTSTKDAVYTVLSGSDFVRKSDKSFNSEIGVPLTILGLHNAWSDPLYWFKNIVEGFLLLLPSTYPRTLVLEIGADKPGDIASITEWLRPDISIGTHFPNIPVHVEFFESPQAVMDEDAKVFTATKREGTVILNHDDPNMLEYRAQIEHSILTYGFSSGADVVGSRARVKYKEKRPVGMSCNVVYQDQMAHVEIFGVLGEQHLYPVLAALAAGVARGVRLEDAAKYLETHRPPPGRMNLLEGIKHTLLIDDTYNASPVAVERALDVLGTLTGMHRRIAVLGDMLELGRFSASEHRRIGALVPSSADILVAVGLRARGFAEGAREGGMDDMAVFHFETALEAGKFLQGFILENDYLLIKGSQSIRMERAVEEIMAHPEKKRDLLVRQDAFWLGRS